MTTLGSVPIAEYATPSTRALPEAVSKYIKAHDGMLLANHGALTVGADLFAAYFKMETLEHFAHISFIARMLGGERLLSRDEVLRLQGLRGMYGIAAPGADLPGPRPTGRGIRPIARWSWPAHRPPPGRDRSLTMEIRLTYGELTALIEDAVRNLK